MNLDGICLNCFAQRGDYDVCPHCGYMAGSAQQEVYLLVPGTVLQNRYVLGTLLGVGGFGAIYKAWDSTLGILVAVKEFYPQGLVSRIPGQNQVIPFSGEKQKSYTLQLARFMEEARNMAQFGTDSHIVNVFDYFEANGTAYLVMEYLKGMTLKAYLQSRGGRLPTNEAVGITMGLLQALRTIHNMGVIHRDISPDNIFILPDGQMKLLDFGAARFGESEDPALAQAVVIKMGYAPPEQYRSNMKQGVWTDIYATGATLYKMLTGQTPDESVDRMEKETLRRPSKMGLPVDAWLEKIVLKAMALQPELRFKNAEAMLTALQNQGGADFPEDEIKKRRARRGVLVGLAIALLLGLAVLAGVGGAGGGGKGVSINSIPPTSITVLVPGEGGIEQIYGELAKTFNEQYPEHTVQLKAMNYDGLAAGNYGALGGTDAPALYYSNGLADGPPAANLSEFVASLGGRDYFFFDRYESIYPKADRLPVSFYCATLFVDTAQCAELGIALPDSVQNLQALDDLLAQGNGALVQIPPYVKERIPGFPNIAHSTDEYSVSTIFQLDFNYMIGFHQVMWRGHYRVLPIGLTGEGGTMGVMNDEWSVNPNAGEDEQKLAMVFLQFLLSDYAQNRICVQGSLNFPMNKATMEAFIAVSPEMAWATDDFLQHSTMVPSSAGAGTQSGSNASGEEE